MSRKGCINSDTHEKGLVFSSCKYKRLERGPLRSLFAWASYGSAVSIFCPCFLGAMPYCQTRLLDFSQMRSLFVRIFSFQRMLLSQFWLSTFYPVFKVQTRSYAAKLSPSSLAEGYPWELCTRTAVVVTFHGHLCFMFLTCIVCLSPGIIALKNMDLLGKLVFFLSQIWWEFYDLGQFGGNQ